MTDLEAALYHAKTVWCDRSTAYGRSCDAHQALQEAEARETRAKAAYLNCVAETRDALQRHVTADAIWQIAVVQDDAALAALNVAVGDIIAERLKAGRPA